MRCLATLALCLLPFAANAELGLNVYGLSYHFDRDKAKEIGTDNELNPGVGVRWRQVEERWTWFADAGFYKDSGRNIAKLAGVGAFWHFGQLRLGGALAVLNSDTYNRGKTFVAPLPVAAWEFRRVTLNMVYMPKVHEVNDINTLGFWLTVWLR